MTDANPDTVAARIQMAPRSTSRPIAKVTKASNAAIHDPMNRRATSRP